MHEKRNEEGGGTGEVGSQAVRKGRWVGEERNFRGKGETKENVKWMEREKRRK